MRQAIKKFFVRHGYEIRKIAPDETDPYDVTAWLVQGDDLVVFDVGANVGYTTDTFRRNYPKAQIHSFEPFPEAFETMRGKFESEDRIRLNQLAISDKPGMARLSVNSSDMTNSLLATDDRATSYWGAGKYDLKNEIEVETQTIDGYCAAQNIAHIHLMKIDVQGAEHAVLEGARQMLSKGAIDLILMEIITAPTYVGQRDMRDYFNFFSDMNYKLFSYYSPVYRFGRLIQTDNIFVHADFLDAYEKRVHRN